MRAVPSYTRQVQSPDVPSLRCNGLLVSILQTLCLDIVLESLMSTSI